MIHKVTKKDDFQVLAKLLNESFATVVEEFKLTKQNHPANSAFISAQELKKKLGNAREYYCYKTNDTIVGFISIERSGHDPHTFYVEMVAVHPSFRRKDIGCYLMNFASERIKEQGGLRISIGLMDSDTRLKAWYKKQGFITVEVKSDKDLPFDICLMEKWMHVNLRIEPIGENDFGKLLHLFHEFAIFEKLPEKMINTVERMHQEKEHIKGFTVKDKDDNICGYVTFFFGYYTWCGKSLYMDDLYIRRDYRGQGLGTMLIHQVIAFAKESKCRKLRWQVSNWNEPAIKFYESFGAEINHIEQNCDLLL